MHNAPEHLTHESAPIGQETTSYRPHNPGHDYYEAGTYLITLVVRNRRDNLHMFGHINDDAKSPATVNNALGAMICEEWQKIPAFEATKGRQVAVHAAVCMPDHFHGVIEVKERMACSLGQLIWGFKVACTKRWRLLAAQQQAPTESPAVGQPTTAALKNGGAEAQQGAAVGQPTTAALKNGGTDDAGTKGQPSLVVRTGTHKEAQQGTDKGALQEKVEVDLHRMSRKQRAAYYEEHPEEGLPLWDDNYDDTICIDDEHLMRMVHYVHDNPRRAVMRHLFPHFMQRCMHIVIDGIDYAAFGNLFLLRWACKEQVFCHRCARLGHLDDDERRAHGYAYAATDEVGRPYLGRLDVVTRVPYETTKAYQREHDTWVSKIKRGATVIVTPGISNGEKQMKNECIANGYPLIHIQKEPIGRWWKPEQSRFDACSKGSLLILAPWNGGEMGDVDGVPAATRYACFHNLNKLAEMICAFDGNARIVRMG